MHDHLKTKAELIEELESLRKRVAEETPGERKQEEEKLRVSNQKLLAQTQELSRMATVVIDSNDAITIQDLNGNITAWNAGAVKTYGYSEPEALKMNVSDLVPEKYKAEALNFIVRLKKGELVESLETKRLTKDGKTLDVWIVVTRLVDEEGKLIGVATTERDITERKQAEEALRNHHEHLEKLVGERTSELKIEITERKQVEKVLSESESKYRTLFEGVPDAIFFFDPVTFEILNANEATSNIYGYDRDELIGMSCLKFSAEIDKSKNVASKILKDGQASADYRHHKNKDGSDLYVNLTGHKITVNGHDLFFSICRDSTKRKQAEEALAQSDSLRELLLDIITHDLKNPAGVIYSLSEAARQDMPENKFLEAIYTSSGRLIEVLNQTTTLSQAAFGETIQKESLSLNTLLQETADEFASALSTAEMELVIAIAPDLIIEANPLIGEVFKNYISNAIKYAKDGKRIVIETVVEDQTVMVCVKDFGKTIAKADREQIFERRFQLEDGEKRGRGLGLAIVKRIAGAHGGEVWVEPNTPVGNSFCLRIPL